MAIFDVVNVLAGRGSRFRAAGFSKPKALLRLHGKPVFWWATESVRCSFDVGQMIFVILKAEIDRYGIDRAILLHYPAAKLAVLPEVTSGPMASAIEGCSLLSGGRGLLVNECTQVFGPGATPDGPQMAGVDGFLCHVDGVASFDYAGELDRSAGPAIAHAGAGLYGFRDRETFMQFADPAAGDPGAPAPSMAMVYQAMRTSGKTIGRVTLGDYIPLVTPSDYDAAPNRLAMVNRIGPVEAKAA